MRAIVKVRVVGRCLVLTIPRAVLENTTLHRDDRVMITADGPDRFTVQKEEAKQIKEVPKLIRRRGTAMGLNRPKVNMQISDDGSEMK